MLRSSEALPAKGILRSQYVYTTRNEEASDIDATVGVEQEASQTQPENRPTEASERRTERRRRSEVITLSR
jgi:hypothetical protein